MRLWSSSVPIDVVSAAKADSGSATLRELGGECSKLRILSLSCVYPSSMDRGLGLFVQSRMRHLADFAEIKLIAPIAKVDYSKYRSWRSTRPKVPASEWDGAIEVFHPGWVYPPGGYWWNTTILFLRLLPLVKRIKRGFDFDLIDAHFAFPDGIAACMLARAMGVPFVVTLRGNETMHAQYRQRRRLIAWALRRAARIITLSEDLKRFTLAMGVDENKVKTIPNGVNADVFRPLDRGLCRQKHGVRPDAKVILSAGSLIERKGHHRVVKMAAELVREGLNLELLIAGGVGREGKYEGEIRRTIADAGLHSVVRLVGEVSPERMAELMSAADVLCLASSREGWPNVVHEAMACGSPIVASDVGAVADMVSSPDYGFVVRPGDGEAMTRALRQALTQEWDRCRISKWAHSRTWEQVAREACTELQNAVHDMTGPNRSRTADD